MATKITKAPSPGPKCLRVERLADGTSGSLSYGALKASWGNPGDALEDSNHKWACVDSRWDLKASNGMSATVVEQRGSGHATGDHVWVRDQGLADNHTIWYDRSRYHPRTLGRYLQSVAVDVFAINSKGQNHAKLSASFARPKAPTIAEWELDESTGTITTSIETDAGEGWAERYDTYWCITRQDSANRENEYATEKVVRAWAPSTDTEVDVSRQDQAARALQPGEWVRYTVKAYARGLAGDSATASRSYTFAPPSMATIGSIVASSMDGAGVVSVRFDTNATSGAPVDSVTLQRLADTQIASAATAALSTGWDDVITDDGNCSGLCDSVAEAMPSPKRHTWYRVATERAGVTRYSVPVEAECLYHMRDAATGDAVHFMSLEPVGPDSVRVRLGWATDEYTVTQVSWSTHEDAWESTEQPNTFDLAWEDDTPETHAHSASLTVRGLAEGVPVWFRARRYVDEDGVTRYSDWCDPSTSMSPVTPSSAPAGPVLSAPAIVARGQGIPLSWTFATGAQTAWQVVSGDVELASGDGTASSCTIPPEDYGDAATVALALRVTAGGDWSESEPVSVTVADAPSVAVAVPATLAAQPLAVVVSSDTPTAQATIRVVSRGSATDAPGGLDVQAEGDGVWATVVTPAAWASSNGAWAATVTAPSRLDLRDGATYDVSVVATDAGTGLTSEAAQASFSVSWSHQAACPGDGSSLVADQGSLSVSVTPSAPSGAAQTDVCDVWRVTPDRAYLVASDVAFGSTVVDRFAPYGTGVLAYRLCTRTADGDIDWRDVPYELRGGSLRLDFGASQVELPYNIALQDSWRKGYEGVRHFGEHLEDGYWDGGSARTATLSTDVFEADLEQQEALRELARFAGPVMVRTPDGLAFDANVDVREMGRASADGIVAVSLDATECRLTEAHMAVPEGYGDEPGEEA